MTTFKTIDERQITTKFKGVEKFKNASVAQKTEALIKAGVKKDVAASVVKKMKTWNAVSFYKAAVSLADGKGRKLGVQSHGKKDGYLTTREASRVFADKKITVAKIKSRPKVIKTETKSIKDPATKVLKEKVELSSDTTISKNSTIYNTRPSSDGKTIWIN